MTSFEIGQAIGRSRQAVDSYISDLRASFQKDLDLKILRMNGLHVPQERMANRLGVLQQTISIHLQKMPELAKLVNTDLSKGFTVSQVAEKHGWTEPMVWSIALEGKSDPDRFKALNWGLRTWDMWNWNDCDKRFGDDWPIKGKTKPDLIIFDPPYFKKQSNNYDPDGISGRMKERQKINAVQAR
ncbi:MAG: hypothetical protein U9N47_07415 [Thermodesulfobacteriota bacterium]|nr:hypothetical protein [Thermodesulfobacteriota bacterium]